jgi:tRNA dimethylallyltransferase
MAVPPIIILTGPTGVGKTALAVAAAGRLNAEIVSADSRQVYRYMDFGTAKPTAAERLEARHWLIDVAYPNRPFSVMDFRRRAERAIADIRSRGQRVLVVGGSPHYVSALVDGIEPPPVSRRLRAWLEAADRARPRALDPWLQRLDPAAAERIDPANRRRVIRAVEATLTAGRPFSRGSSRAPRGDVLWIGLRMQRPALHARIRRRVEAMLEAGWLAETRRLLAMGFAPELPALSATGYAELARVLGGELELAEAARRITFATNAFIRRQETWFRKEPRIRWLGVEEGDLVDRFVGLVEAPA